MLVVLQSGGSLTEEIIRTSIILICVGILLGAIRLLLSKPISGLPKKYRKVINQGFDEVIKIPCDSRDNLSSATMRRIYRNLQGKLSYKRFLKEFKAWKTKG